METITREQQIKMGLIQPAERFVPALPAKQGEILLPAQRRHEQTLDVTPTATQHIEMKTSAKDRSLGFLIAGLPLYSAFSLAVVLACVSFWSIPFLSFGAFLIYWLTFVAAWGSGYVTTLLISAEGIAFFEAWQKWRILAREQQFMWQHYTRKEE